MKFINFLLLVIFLSGCAHQQQINVRNQILADADTPQHVKEKIINKQISVGMTKKHKNPAAPNLAGFSIFILYKDKSFYLKSSALIC